MCVEAGYATAAVGRSWAGPGDHAGRAEMVLGRGRNPERVGTSQCSRQARQGGARIEVLPPPVARGQTL